MKRRNSCDILVMWCIPVTVSGFSEKGRYSAGRMSYDRRGFVAVLIRGGKVH